MNRLLRAFFGCLVMFGFWALFALLLLSGGGQ